MMDSIKHKNISGNLEVWTVDGAVKMRVNFGMSARVVTLTAVEAVLLADWLQYEFWKWNDQSALYPNRATGRSRSEQ